MDNTEVSQSNETQDVVPAKREARELQAVGPDVSLLATSPFDSQHAFVLAQRMAMVLASSSIVPNDYRTDYQDKDGMWLHNPAAVGNCFIALELSNRLRTSPILIMQQVDMIYGRPALRGTLLIGLINAAPEFGKVRFECTEGVASSAPEYGYRAIVRDRETGEDLVGPWITWKMVRAEKWNDKKGSKWGTMPDQMFQYRAASFWSRLFASHITLGLYESEEARDVFDDVPDTPTRASLLEQRSDAPADAPTDGSFAPPENPAEKPRAARRAVRRKEPAPAEDNPPADEGAAEASDTPTDADADAAPFETAEQAAEAAAEQEADSTAETVPATAKPAQNAFNIE